MPFCQKNAQLLPTSPEVAWPRSAFGSIAHRKESPKKTLESLDVFLGVWVVILPNKPEVGLLESEFDKQQVRDLKIKKGCRIPLDYRGIQPDTLAFAFFLWGRIIEAGLGFWFVHSL